MAKIGNVEYTSLQAAFDAAKAGETVELLGNVALESNIEFANKDITFNLGGFTLSNKNNSDDLYCFNIEASTLVVTNGVIDAGAGEAIESTGASHITIACDAELKGTGAYTFYPSAAIVDIYGKITTTGSELPCIWLTAEGEVVNVYDGAVLTSQGDVFRHRCNTAEVSANSAVLNIYGGEMTSKGYPVVYAYASAGKVNSGYVNVYGGTFIVANSDGNRPFSKTAEMTYLPLTDECTAKFNCNVDLASYCAEGYAPVKGDDNYYTIQMADYAIDYAYTGVAEDDVAKIDNSKNPTSYTIATETITFADPTLEGYTFKGWDIASIEKGSTGAKTITGTFEKEQGGIVPGGEPVPVAGDDEAAAQEAANKLPIVLTQAQKDAGLTTADFCNKVRPAAAGGFEAYVEVAAANAPVIETESTDVKPIEVGATDFSATIKNAKPGLYYGFKAVNALGTSAVFEPVGEAATATVAGDLKITAPKGEGNARFYKLTVSITDIWAK